MRKLPLIVLVAAIGSAGFVAAGHAVTGAPVTMAIENPGFAAPAPILPDDLVQLAQAAAGDVDVAVLMTEGQPVYNTNCAACHGPQGAGGTANAGGPPLVANAVVTATGALVQQIINGYMEHGMPPFGHLSDRDIAAVSTFVRNSWGNDFGPVQPSVVATIRADLARAPAE